MEPDFVIRLPELHPTTVLQTLSETYDWGALDLHIPDIHKQTMGEGIKIGVVDSGKCEHFEVQQAVKESQNFSDSHGVEDRHGHSTFISGIIAAAANNEGIIGIAPKSELYFAKAISDGGVGNPSWMVQAINWLITEQVDIISISSGMFDDFQPLHTAVQVAHSKNIIVVAAAGNSGNRYEDVAFPARYPEVISVAAYSKTHHVAPFSSRGVNVTFAMPGVDIYSTWLNNQYATMSGTSFSCPILSAVCALILSKHRFGKDIKTPQQMIEHLKKYAVTLDDPTSTGFGTIDLGKMFSED